MNQNTPTQPIHMKQGTYSYQTGEIWTRLAEKLILDPVSREKFTNWCAYTIQFPDKKIRWALQIRHKKAQVSSHGLIAPFVAAARDYRASFAVHPDNLNVQKHTKMIVVNIEKDYWVNPYVANDLINITNERGALEIIPNTLSVVVFDNRVHEPDRRFLEVVFEDPLRYVNILESLTYSHPLDLREWFMDYQINYDVFNPNHP